MIRKLRNIAIISARRLWVKAHHKLNKAAPTIQVRSALVRNTETRDGQAVGKGVGPICEKHHFIRWTVTGYQLIVDAPKNTDFGGGGGPDM